jgi:subtilisin family serine protease
VRLLTVALSTAAVVCSFAALADAAPARGRMTWSVESRVAKSAIAPVAAYRGGRAIVGLTTLEAIDSVERRYGVLVVHKLPKLRAVEVEGQPVELHALDAGSLGDARIRYVEPPVSRELLHQRDDPLTYTIDPSTRLPYQWQFQHIGLDKALNLSQGSAKIVVGIVDSGYTSIPDLAGKVVSTWNLPSDSDDPLDEAGHGTFVASLIAARNDDGTGIAGSCGACRVSMFKLTRLTAAGMAQAVRHLVDGGAKVVNLSLGGYTPSNVEADAISYATSHGTLVVAAAGNDGVSTPVYPAARLQPTDGTPGAGLAVGASDAGNRRAPFSNWGDWLSLLAPGSSNGDCRFGVFGAQPTTPTVWDEACGARVKLDDTRWYGYAEGTSFAAPQVAGVAALVWAARPELTSRDVIKIVLDSAARAPGTGRNSDSGSGVLDAEAALELATGRSSADTVAVAVTIARNAPSVQRIDLYGTARWQDGIPIATGTVSCKATVAGGVRRASAAALRDGKFRCSWPSARPLTRLVGSATVTDAEGVTATRRFSARVRTATDPTIPG